MTASPKPQAALGAAIERVLAPAPFTIGFLLGLAFWVGVQAGIVLTLFAFWWRPPL